MLPRHCRLFPRILGRPLCRHDINLLSGPGPLQLPQVSVSFASRHFSLVSCQFTAFVGRQLSVVSRQFRAFVGRQLLVVSAVVSC